MPFMADIMKIDIKGGEIKQIIIGDFILPLKKSMKLSEADKIEQMASLLEEYIDFSKIGIEKNKKSSKEDGFEWTKEELISFLNQTDSKKQKIFLKSLAKYPERLTWDQVKDIMEKNGEELEAFSMAGLLSCYARRAKHYGRKEDFWISDWDDIKNERYYQLKKSYRIIFKEFFRGE